MGTQQPETQKTAESTASNVGPHAALLATQLFFGTLPVIGKVVLAVLPAVSLVGIRLAVTAAVFAVVQGFRGAFWLKHRADYLRLAVLSLFGVTLNQLLFIGGLSFTKASNTSLLIVTIPIFTLIVSVIARTETLRLLKAFGILLAAAGVLFLIDPRQASFSSETTVGDLMIIANSLSYGIYVATSRDVISRNGALLSMMWVFIFATLTCAPLTIASLGNVELSAVPAEIWLLALYTGIGATAVPYLLNAYAITRVAPSVVAVYIYLQPLIGFVTAVAFLGEAVESSFIAAMALIFSGVYFTTMRPGRDRRN